MATQGLSTGSLKRVRSLIKQWEATHGRKATPDVTRAIMEGELAVASKGATEAVKLEQEQERIDFNKQQTLDAQKKQEKASQISGVVQTGLLAKELGAGKGLKTLGGKLFGGGATGAGATGVGEALGTTQIGLTAGEPALAAAGEQIGFTAGEPALSAAGEQIGFTAGEPALTGTTAAGGEAGGGFAGGFSATNVAAFVILDSMIARSKSGGFKTARERSEANRLGFRMGGISPGAAATLQGAGVLSLDQLLDKHLGSDFAGLEEDVMDFVDKIGGSLADDISDFANSLGF